MGHKFHIRDKSCQFQNITTKGKQWFKFEWMAYCSLILSIPFGEILRKMDSKCWEDLEVLVLPVHQDFSTFITFHQEVMLNKVMNRSSLFHLTRILWLLTSFPWPVEERINWVLTRQVTIYREANKISQEMKMFHHCRTC